MTLRHWDQLLGRIDLRNGITFGSDDTYRITKEKAPTGQSPKAAEITGQGAPTGGGAGGDLRISGGDPGATGQLAGNVAIELGAPVSTTTAALSIETQQTPIMQLLQHVGMAAVRAAGSRALQLYSASSVRLETALRSLVLDESGELTASFLTRFTQTSGQRIVGVGENTVGAITINLNFDNYERWSYAISGDVTFAAPTNVVHGARYTIRIRQATGGHTATWNSVFKFGALDGTLTSDVNAIDIFVFEGSNNGDLHCIIAAKGVHA